MKPNPQSLRAFANRIGLLVKSRVSSRKSRNSRSFRVEQLEARRLLAAAILEDTAIHSSHGSDLEVAVGSLSTVSRLGFPDSFYSSQEIQAEGEAAPASVFYYSPSVPGFVKNSNHSALFVDDSDIVKLSVFSPNQWTHEIYFDGSDVGLTTNAENVDAFAIRPDGSLLFSTVGSVGVPGVAAASEDVLLFRPTTLGTHTAGTWQMYVDGSDIGISTWEGVDGLSQLPDGRLIISTQRTASLPGISGSVAPEDLVALTLNTTGNHTSGTWATILMGVMYTSAPPWRTSMVCR